MKHPVAVAIMNGFTAALAAEVDNGGINQTTAGQVTRFATAIAMEYLKGNRIFGHKLTDFAQDGQMLDDGIAHNKVKLASFE